MTLQELANLNLVSALGIASLPKEEQGSFLQKAEETILARAVQAIEKILPEEKKQEFYRIFETPHSDEERAAFLKKEVSDIETIILREALFFKAESLEQANKL